MNLKDYERAKISKIKETNPQSVGGMDRTTLMELLDSLMQSLYSLCRDEYSIWANRLKSASKKLTDLRAFIFEGINKVKQSLMPKPV